MPKSLVQNKTLYFSCADSPKRAGCIQPTSSPKPPRPLLPVFRVLPPSLLSHKQALLNPNHFPTGSSTIRALTHQPPARAHNTFIRQYTHACHSHLLLTSPANAAARSPRPRSAHPYLSAYPSSYPSSSLLLCPSPCSLGLRRTTSFLEPGEEWLLKRHPGKRGRWGCRWVEMDRGEGVRWMR